MPGATYDDLHGHDGRPQHSGYLSFNSQQPTKTAVQTGLALLAFLIAIRFCLQRGASCLRQSRARQPSCTPRQLQLQPVSPTIDQKMQTKTYHYSRAATTERRGNTVADVGGVPAPAPSAVPERQRRLLLARLPVAPPLTPPELSPTIFACEEDVDGFISQPNPDYMSATSSLPFQTALPTQRRRCYMKTPTSEVGASSSSDKTFGPPSAYPSSPLPSQPAPANEGQQQVPAEEDGMPRQNLSLKGEIISVVNEDGAGWSRHTRVYGGGVCLACATSGVGCKDDFYVGAVTPESMRH